MFGRISLFIIYFGFGLLKLIGLSPASDLVHALYLKTPIISALPFQQFYLAFALFEMVIGLLFLFKKFTKLASILFFVHIVMTALPLILLPVIAWQKFLVPTLEGQYIIKNLALVAVVLFILRNRRY